MDEKILLDVEVRSTEALQAFVKLKEQAASLKEQQRALDLSTQEGRQAYQTLALQIKAVNAEAARFEKQIKNEIKQQNAQENSLQQLKAKLANLRTEYEQLGDAARTGTKGMQTLEEIQNVTQKLTEAEHAMGDFHRQVGNYEIAGKSLRMELKELVAQLAEMKMAGQENSAEYQQMAASAAKMRDAMDDVNQQIRNAANDTGSLQGAIQSVNALVAGGTIIKSVFGDSETAEEMTRILQKSIAIMQALTVIQNAMQKQSAAMVLYKKLENALLERSNSLQQTQTLLKTKATAAEAAHNAAKASGNTITAIMTGLQWKLNAAMAANPVGALIALFVAVAAASYKVAEGFDHLIGNLSKGGQAAKEAEAKIASMREEYERLQKDIDGSKNKQNLLEYNATIDTHEAIRALKEMGASEEEIAKKRLEIEAELTAKQIEETKKRKEDYYLQKRDALDAYDSAKKALDEMSKWNVNWGKTCDAANEAYDAWTEAIKNERAEHIALQELLTKQQEQKEQLTALDKKAAEDAKKAADERRKAAYEAANKTMEQAHKFADEQAKLTETTLAKDFATQQEWQRKEFARKQQQEREKLALQKQYGMLAAQDYAAQIALLDAQMETFNAQQQKALQEQLQQGLESAKSLLEQTIQEQIEALDKQYKDAHNALVVFMGTANEEELDAAAEMMERLNTQHEKAVQELQQKQAQALISTIAGDVSKAYELDLAQYADNEAEKGRIQLKMKEERVAALRKTLSQEELSETELYELKKALLQEEAELRKTQRDDRLNALNKELADETLTLTKKHALKQEYYAQELALAEGNAERQAEIRAQMAEDDKAYTQAMVNNVSEWANKAKDLLGGVNDLMKANEESQLQEYEQANEQKKTALQERLDKGLISQEQYDKQVAAADAELDKQKAEIALKQAKREKALNIAQALINTAMAISKTLAQMGLPLGLPAIALASAMGALQVATIAATPLPKARRGGLVGDSGNLKFSQGGLLHGPSHAQGGIPIEAEGGEAIINKRSTATFRPILSAINEWGGGVKFANGGVVGVTGQQAQTVTNSNALSQEMAGLMSQVKIYTAITDIHRGEANYAQIEGLRR